MTSQTKESECLGDEFDNSVQCYTMCQKCGNVNWCVVNDIDLELCKGCYSGEEDYYCEVLAQ